MNEKTKMMLAIIPARGGSKRIPRKNIRTFAGKPMIGYAIEAARKAGVFGRIVVSTDDAEIAEISLALGAEVPFMRPPELAHDHSATVPVVAHAIRACQQHGSSIDQVCCIYPGVPLLRVGDILQALKLLEERESSYAFPVLPFPSPIQRALRRDPDGATHPLNPRYIAMRTQDLEPAYYDAGQFYWGQVQAWLSELPVHGNSVSIVLPEWCAVDIDTPSDWERAEVLYHAVSEQSGR